MARMKVMISAPYLQPEIERFRGLFTERGIDLVIPPVNERMSENELLQWVGDIDGAITGDDSFTDAVLAVAPRLRVISKWGTGIDSIDQEACARRGVQVCNTPNAFSEPVADTVLGYMLCFARGLPFMDRFVRDGRWQKLPGTSLGECTLGIIGVGDCGKAVARRACSFGMRILGCDPVAMPESFLAETGVEMVSRERLLAESDFISLNCTLNETSHHIMSDEAFAQVKPTMVLVNAARGPLIDEAALVTALRADRIGGVGLDVFEVEPLPQDSALREFPNVMFAPHNANSSPRAWERVHDNTIRNCFTVLLGDQG